MFFIDWISATTHVEGEDAQDNCVLTIQQVLGGQWLETRGRNGYQQCVRHASGALLLWDGQPGMGVHVSLPGDALAAFGDRVTDLLSSYAWVASRVDIAHDTDQVTVDWIVDNVSCVVCRAQKRTLVHSLDTGAKTLYIGSLSGGRKVVRIYNKSAESGLDGVLTRIEVQLRGEYAAVALAHIMSGGAMADVVARCVDFRTPGKGRVTEWSRCQWWEAAIEGAVGGFRFPVRTPFDGGVRVVSRWIERYVAPSLVRCHAALGEVWLRSILIRGSRSVDVGYYIASSP